jgi:hypothetical protein
VRYFEQYMGDGAYGYMNEARQVVLYTSNGVEETNEVVLEPEVLELFLNWAATLPERIKRLQKERG